VNRNEETLASSGVGAVGGSVNIRARPRATRRCASASLMRNLCSEANDWVVLPRSPISLLPEVDRKNKAPLKNCEINCRINLKKIKTKISFIKIENNNNNNKIIIIIKIKKKKKKKKKKK
jgi:hypothetical protein